MNLSEIQDKDVVNLVDGKKIGNIIDVRISREFGSIISIVVETGKGNFNIFNSKEQVEITWKQIERIGEDVILVRIN